MKMSFNYRVCQRERENFYLHIYTQSPTTVTPVQLEHTQEGYMTFRHVTHFSYSLILNEPPTHNNPNTAVVTCGCNHSSVGVLLHSNTQATQVRQREELEVGTGMGSGVVTCGCDWLTMSSRLSRPMCLPIGMV